MFGEREIVVSVCLSVAMFFFLIFFSVSSFSNSQTNNKQKQQERKREKAEFVILKHSWRHRQTHKHTCLGMVQSSALISGNLDSEDALNQNTS